jgi:hypothetical protein
MSKQGDARARMMQAKHQSTPVPCRARLVSIPPIRKETAMSTIHEMLIANRLLHPSGKPASRMARRLASKPVSRPASSAFITEYERQQRIADNAYYRAERRHFAPGYELIDWFAAEAEVDRQLVQEGSH